MKPAVISMCDKTGIMVRPWAEAGCECWCVDIQHSIRRERIEPVGDGLIHFTWGDARSWRLPAEARGRVVIGFGFPPCTHLTVSDARDFRDKGGWMLADSLQLFDSIEVAFSFGGFPYMIENPTGRLNTHRREPDYTFNPNDYGDPYTKGTGLWWGNGFVLPPIVKPGDLFDAPTWVEPAEGSRMHKMTPSEERADLRSATPIGLARAVFEANQKLLLMEAA